MRIRFPISAAVAVAVLMPVLVATGAEAQRAPAGRAGGAERGAAGVERGAAMDRAAPADRGAGAGAGAGERRAGPVRDPGPSASVSSRSKPAGQSSATKATAGADSESRFGGSAPEAPARMPGPDSNVSARSDWTLNSGQKSRRQRPKDTACREPRYPADRQALSNAQVPTRCDRVSGR